MRSTLLMATTALVLNVNALNINNFARCGRQTWNILTCKHSLFGHCCSKDGYCGSTAAHCGTGCQKGFGSCSPPSPPTGPTSSSIVRTSTVRSSTFSSSSRGTPSSTLIVTTSSIPAPVTSSSVIITSSVATSSVSSSAPAASTSSTVSLEVSTDGSCGGTNGFTCSGSPFGDCCSGYGWCGNTDVYCGAECNAAFGSCGGAGSSPVPTSSSQASSSSALASSTTLETVTSAPSSTTISSAAPSSTGKVSTDGQCGASYGGTICLGSGFGDCCSEYGWCGSTSVHCGTGCQEGFGKCDNALPSASVTDPSTPSGTSTAPSPTLTCGVEGFANNVDYYASSFNLLDTTDVALCATRCLAEPTCKSYLFNPLLGNCAYLVYSLEQGEFIPTDDTDQLFWERGCAE